MNADELRTRLYRHEWPESLAPDLDSHVVFRALYGVFVDRSRPESAFFDQQIAGQLLVRLLPEPDAPLADLIRESLDTWNASVTDLPRYLAQKFGAPSVLAVVEQLERTPGLTGDQLRVLDTHRYWLGG
jgi:hypothetical protein